MMLVILGIRHTHTDRRIIFLHNPDISNSVNKQGKQHLRAGARNTKNV